MTHRGSDPAALRAERVAALHAVSSWAPVIGADVLPALGRADLVVVDGLPDDRGDSAGARERLAAVRATGALAIAYLSVGTVEDWRAYAPEVAPGWTLGPVPGWPGERYADARAVGWRRIVTREAAGLQALGFDGLWLDNLDVAEEHSRSRDALVVLVAAVRAAAPALVLIAQNGLAVIDRLAVDGLCHEDTWWRSAGDGYAPTAPAETAAIVSALRRQRARGLVVLTLDYTEHDAPEAELVAARSRAEGFVPAVSLLALDRAPHGPAATR